MLEPLAEADQDASTGNADLAPVRTGPWDKVVNV
jgi:hypothetical protein